MLEIREKKLQKQGVKKQTRKDGDYYAKFKTHHALPFAARIVESRIKENFAGHKIHKWPKMFVNVERKNLIVMNNIAIQIFMRIQIVR